MKEIYEDLIKARKEIKNLYPTAKGYSYEYVPLEKVVDHLKEILPKYNLGYVQLPSGGSAETVGLTTIIIHGSGESIEKEAEFPITDMKGVNKSQAAGAAITYFRRYALCSAFGITGDKDTDCHGEEKKSVIVTDEFERMNNCQDLEELQKIWNEIAPKFKGSFELKDLKLCKDENKKRFSDDS